MMMSPASRLKSFTDRYPYLGPVIWMLTVEYFVIQWVVAADWSTPYSVLRNPISDLGNTSCGIYDGRQVCSPLHNLMNLSLIILGVVMILGAPLIYQEFRERPLNLVGFICMGIAGLGTLLVGVFPENVEHVPHVIGAGGPFLVGNLALVILSVALDLPRAARIYTRLSGALGLLGLLFLVTGLHLGLDQGGMERVTAYPQTIWLIFFGIYTSGDHYLRRRMAARVRPAI
jgi:hypothetical membrane protein